MRHTDRLSSRTTLVRAPRPEGDWLLAVAAFVGFIVVPGGGLVALVMLLTALGRLLWVLLSAAGSVTRTSTATIADAVRSRSEKWSDAEASLPTNGRAPQITPRCGFR